MSVMQAHAIPMLLAATTTEDSVALATNISLATASLAASTTSALSAHAQAMLLAVTARPVSNVLATPDTKVTDLTATT